MDLYEAYSRWVYGVLVDGHEGVFWSEQMHDGTRSFRFGLGQATPTNFDCTTGQSFFWTDYHGTKRTIIQFQSTALPTVAYDLQTLPSFMVHDLSDHIQTTAHCFQQNVQKARAAAHAGDIWVVNVAHQLAGPLPDATALLAAFGAFLRFNRPHRGGVVWTHGTTFASFSPEAFLTVEDGRVQTNPIKGTGTREYLEHSEKERSELLMVTDLLRNDLGMICESVHVQTLRHIFPVGDFYHAEAIIEGALPAGHLREEEYAQLLPAGSITGAPKHRACALIDQFEDAPRGLYTGTFGWKEGPALKSSILIRTLFAEGNKWNYGTGAGITHASDPEEEWRETLAKAALLRMLSA